MPNVYFFGDGATEGDASMKALLGGKGANLSEMSNIGIPVPPGFTITTEVCVRYLDNRSVADDVRQDVRAAVARIERADDSLGDLLDPIVDIELGQLVQQKIVERFRSRDGVGHQVMTAIGIFGNPIG